MRKRIFVGLILLFILTLVIVDNNSVTIVDVYNKQYNESVNVVDLTVGTYTSSDGHKIEVISSTSVKYDDAYNLTATSSNRGYLISGKLGSNNKVVNFYQVNDSTIVSGTTVSYIHNSTTTYLYEYTVFRLNKDSNNAEGKIEVYHNNNLIGKYTYLQSAVDNASNGDTIKITDNIDVLSGAYINKNLIIDGNEKTLNYATWSNGVFIVEEGASLEIKNLTIDGGSTGFKVNYDGVTFNDYLIPLISGSDTLDIKQNLSAIITKGKLNATNLKLNNIYSINGSALNIVRGESIVKNSSFNHNRSTTGGAVYINGTFRTEQNVYPVTNVEFINVEFKNNYASENAGAVYILNARDVLLDECEFNSNTANKGYGGAILIDKLSTKVGSVTYYSPGHAAGLDFTQLKIKSTDFVNNWTGNDGSAIQNYDAEISVVDSKFDGNVGVHPSSSVGTLSYYVYRQNSWAEQSISNSIFENNKGPTSVIGDHGTMVTFNIDNTKFIENDGWHAIAFYTGVASFDKCQFIKDKSSKVASIYLLSSDFEEYYEGTGYDSPTLILNDTIFEDSQSEFDVYSYIYPDGSDYVKPKVKVNGNSKANIDLKDGSTLTLNGILAGTIRTDYRIEFDEQVIIKDGGVLNTVNIASNTLITYKNDDGTEESKQVALDSSKKITPYYVTSLLELEKDGYMMYYYTDETYTTKWDYEVQFGTELYGRWEEHNHEFTNYLVLDNTIYEECSCGKLNSKISLEVPSDLVFNGKSKPIVVLNELGISKTEYKIVYFKKENNVWVEIDFIPVDVGEYKASLSFNGLNIEKEYNIVKKVVNPNTGFLDKEGIFILCVIFISIMFMLIINKKHFKKYEVNN